jgi:hypothetical protein
MYTLSSTRARSLVSRSAHDKVVSPIVERAKARALGGEYHGALFLSELVTIAGKQWIHDSKEKKSRRNSQQRQLRLADRSHKSAFIFAGKTESAVLLHRAVGPIVRFEQFPNTLWIMLFDSGGSPRTITR